jgi:hypothetical protein
VEDDTWAGSQGHRVTCGRTDGATTHT